MLEPGVTLDFGQLVMDAEIARMIKYNPTTCRRR